MCIYFSSDIEGAKCLVCARASQYCSFGACIGTTSAVMLSGLDGKRHKDPTLIRILEQHRVRGPH